MAQAHESRLKPPRNYFQTVSERKKKDRLAAVSPKSDQVFGSGGCESSVLPLPAPAKQTHHAEATSEEREGGWERGC
jgi:hypothetical protein